jgi:hypothetical protein
MSLLTTNNPKMNYEVDFVNTFVTGAKRRRYLALLESRKGRAKLIERLDHFGDLDRQRAQLVPPSAQTVNDIHALLKRKGAPERCYVTSSNEDLDAREMVLRDALEQTVGQGSGTIISCIPGKLGYFESEEPHERYILE